MVSPHHGAASSQYSHPSLKPAGHELPFLYIQYWPEITVQHNYTKTESQWNPDVLK